MEYIKAMASFVTIAYYTSFDSETIKYMEHALFLINHTKHTFEQQRRKSSDVEANWNYPKFHAISHYLAFIRRWGAPDGYDTSIFEAAYKYLVKAFYDRTDRHMTYQDQIAEHNTRTTNI